MNDLDLHGIKRRAFKATTHPDMDDFLRHVFRTYSKTFHINIADVLNLPLEDVLYDYYCERYESMDQGDRDEEREFLSKSLQDLLKQKDTEVLEEFLNEEFYRAAEREANKKRAENAANKGEKLPQPTTQPTNQTPKLPPKVAHINPIPSEIPDIKINFGDIDESLPGGPNVKPINSKG